MGAVVVFLILVLHFTAAGTQGAVRCGPLAVRDGNEVTLPCFHHRCNSVTWHFKGLRQGAAEVELFNQGQIKEKATSDQLSLTANCSLVIHKVTVEDAGQYTCSGTDKTGSPPGSVICTDLVVVVITEEKYGDNVTLNCSVSTSKKCEQHKVKWIHDRIGIFIRNPYIKTSQSSCSASVAILNTNCSNISTYDFMCAVTIYNKVDRFPFNPCSTTAENNANTVWFWCRLIIVVLGLTALITVVVVVIIWARAGKKAQTGENTVFN
ncbi:uncharacterized protein LOC116326777 [Oreochromis aureus]|uniref:uncharacterized protein LOC116326777 n=1 Tax=Oreochromis aureus TaxID=47969 RepID=UPI001952EA26|nr:uncharacterized protein LOC116326777 [Oreochromis aureus]